MVKTTINLDTEVYRELVKEAVEKYGTTKTLSKIINEKLKKAIGRKGSGDIVKDTLGAWGKGESGSAYTRHLREETEERVRQRLRE